MEHIEKIGANWIVFKLTLFLEYAIINLVTGISQVFLGSAFSAILTIFHLLYIERRVEQ